LCPANPAGGGGGGASVALLVAAPNADSIRAPTVFGSKSPTTATAMLFGT
jgi:hypothetical protein